MFYVIYRADGPAHQLYASTHMFKTRELAAAHAEAYPAGRNAVVVEGRECLLPGGSVIRMSNAPKFIECPVCKGSDTLNVNFRSGVVDICSRCSFQNGFDDPVVYAKTAVAGNRTEDATMVSTPKNWEGTSKRLEAPTDQDYLDFAVTTLNEVERLWDEGRKEEAVDLFKSRIRDSYRLRRALMESTGFRPLIKKMARYILEIFPEES